MRQRAKNEAPQYPKHYLAQHKITLLQKSSIPFLLIYSRVFIAIVLIFLAFTSFKNRDVVIVVLTCIGVLTDFFDGVLARKWNVSSEKLRVWDSNADQVFWAAVIFAIFYLNFDFLLEQWIPISIIIGLEITTYVISYFRFRKPVATHSLLAKIWTITLFVFLIDLCLNHTSCWFYWICIVLGIVSRLEIIGILLLLKNWMTDVPTILHIKKLNAGLPIKKNKWLNS